MSKDVKLFSPENIKGPYSLLAAFLLIVEASLGYWLINSDDRVEKIIAGAMITLIFVVFLIISLKIVQAAGMPKQLSSEGVGELKPASQTINEHEVDEKNKEVIIGHDRSFMIEKPAGEWEIEELSPADWAGKSIGITDKKILNNLFGDDDGSEKVMVISHPDEVFLAPIPGKTKIDGAVIPSALLVPAFYRLSILPLERRQAPYYINRPLIHNFNIFLMSILGQGVLTLIDQQKNTDKNGQVREIATLRQNLENVEIEGKHYQKASLYISMIGIGGKTKDHAMMLQYFTTTDDNPLMEQRLKELQQIINSFKPVIASDQNKNNFEYNQKMDARFENLIKKYGINMFNNEISIALVRVKDLDLENIHERQKVIETLSPFRQFAEYIKFEDGLLKNLLDAVDIAAKGDATKLKVVLPEIIQKMDQQGQAPKSQ